MSKQLQKLNKKFRRARRGVSPIVAEILLIGLTMLAGAITFGTVMVVMTSKEPITVSIDKFSDFKLIGNSNSTQYNSFSFILDNSGKRAVGIRTQDFELLNASGDPLSNWTLGRDYQLSALQSYSITVSSNNQSTWLDFNTKIEVQLIVYALDSNSYDTADKAVVKASTTITDKLVSVGPLQILYNQNNTSNYVNLTTSDTLAINVENFGHLNASYSLEFIVSALNVTMYLHYNNSSNNLPSVIYGSLGPAQGNNSTLSNTILLTLTKAPPNKFFIIVWLKIDSSIQDSLIISYT